MNTRIYDANPPIDYYLMSVKVFGVFVMQDLNWIYCIFNVFRINMNHLTNPHPMLSFNTLNSPIAMTDSLLIKLPPNKPNTTHSSIIFVQEAGMLRLLLYSQLVPKPQPFINLFHDTFKIPVPTIKHIFRNINIIAIHHAISILLHKQRIENHQSLLDP
jgi:hypothetical protein